MNDTAIKSIELLLEQAKAGRLSTFHVSYVTLPRADGHVAVSHCNGDITHDAEGNPVARVQSRTSVFALPTAQSLLGIPPR